MASPITTKAYPYTVKELKRLGVAHFKFDEEYQRGSVWDLGQKERLLNSIYAGYTIGALVLHERPEHKRVSVLDGQQRLRTIFEFLTDKISFARDEQDHEIRGKKYSKLEKLQAERMNKFVVYAIYLNGGTEDQISDIFLRLQEGKPLNTAEKLNAYTMHGEMRSFVKEISASELFTRIKISKNRFAHRGLAAQCIQLESQVDFDEHLFPDLRYTSLRNLYKEHSASVPKKISSSVRSNLRNISTSMGADAAMIGEKSDLLMIYLLSSYLQRERYILQKGALSSAIKDFLTHVSVGSDSKNKQAQKYTKLRSGGQTTQLFSARFRALLEFMRERHAGLFAKQKDEQRAFSKAQRLKIFQQAGEKCGYCKKKVPFPKANYHHKIKYAVGGSSEDTDNGVLMHIACHVKYHKAHGY